MDLKKMQKTSHGGGSFVPISVQNDTKVPLFILVFITINHCTTDKRFTAEQYTYPNYYCSIPRNGFLYC